MNERDRHKEPGTLVSRKNGSRSIDPFLIAIDIIAVCSFYFDARENLQHIDSTRELLSPEAVEQHNQEAINLILAGVKLRSALT
jgi:hypothetical protein